MVLHLTTIHENSSLHEEIHEVNDVDTSDSVVSTALGAAAIRTGETAMVRVLKYSSNIGCDLQVLIEHCNPVEDNTCVLESDVLDDSTCLMFLEGVREGRVEGSKSTKMKDMAIIQGSFNPLYVQNSALHAHFDYPYHYDMSQNEKNKADLDTISFDDLYKNFKIIKQEVKRTVVLSSSSESPNMALLSSPSSTTKVDTASIQVSAVRTTISTVSSHDNTANLSDATVYAFLTSQPNGSQLVHEDQEQIHEDDLKEMDLKWQLDLLCIRARRYFQKTGKKITINDSNTARYDKTNVECFNCHNMGHFEMECKSPKNQESKPRNQDISRKTVIMEDTSSKAMVAIDGAEFNKSEFDLATYKRGLAFIEEQLVFYKKNEVVFCDQIDVIKRDASFRDSEITALILQIEKLKKEKESNQIKIDNFENASKSLDKLVNKARGAMDTLVVFIWMSHALKI
nr:hypothetical protein [Tanacetum cinerariifolium]